MTSSNEASEFTRENLTKGINEYRESRERLLKIQYSTKRAFLQITNILKSTTAELLDCVNIDNIQQLASELGAIDQATTFHSDDSDFENGYENPTISIVSNSTQNFPKLIIENPAVAVVGQVKAGKSTFVNTLLRKDVVCQAYERCTARLTRLHYSSKNYVEIVDINGNILEHKKLKNTAIPKKFVQLHEDDRANTSEINKLVRAGIKSKFLECGIDIIDSPGLSENATLTNLSKNMIKTILPVMIYVIDGRTSVKQSDITDLLELKNSVPNLQIIYFVTKLDTDDIEETNNKDPIELAKSKLTMAFQKLQFNNFIPKSFQHWSECTYFHGASLYAFIDYFKKNITPETTFHFAQFCKFESVLLDYLLINFETKIFEACATLRNFQMDVLTKIIHRAGALADLTRENLNHIVIMRKIEEELFEKIKSVIIESKKDLICRLIQKLENEENSILDPIIHIEYPVHISIPESGIVNESNIIDQCQNVIMSTLCQGLENIIKVFVEEELFNKYCKTLETQITTRMKTEIGNKSSCISGKSPYRLSLERILASHYKFHTISSFSNTDGKNIILKFMDSIISSIKSFLKSLFAKDTSQAFIDVKSPDWKLSQAKDCLSRCDRNLLAEEVCKTLIDDFECKHNEFLLALEIEYDFVQKKISISEDIRLKMAEKVPDFAGLLMLTLDVQSRYLLKGVEEKERIGQGAQGEVFRCTINNKSIAKKTSTLPITQIDEIAEEVYYSYLFEHPHLLPMIAVSINDTSEVDTKKISVYSPLMKTDVSKYLKINNTTFETRINIGFQVAEALQYLHSQQIMHRDLKLANILLDENNNVFLGDYGFCKSMGLTSHSFVGTPVHIAPEIIRKDSYDCKVDIYSFGVLLWYLAEGTGRHPQFAKVQSNIAQVLWAAAEHNMRPEKLDNISDDLWTLMQQCWDNDPTSRPNIDYVIDKLSRILDSN